MISRYLSVVASSSAFAFSSTLGTYMFFKTVDLMTNMIAIVNKIRKMVEDDQITPKESNNEPYMCSLRVCGKFNFYLDICMKS